MMMINRVNNKLSAYISCDPFDEIHLLTEFSGDRKDRKENRLTENTKAKDRDIKISSSDLLHFQALHKDCAANIYDENDENGWKKVVCKLLVNSL